MKTTLNADTIKSALRAQGVYPFRVESSYPESDAPRNLQGRTHYADPDTLKYFQAKIRKSVVCADSLLYCIVEHVASKPEGLDDKPENKKRFVVFDVFGTVLSDREEWFKTADQAWTAAKAFLSGIDAIEHTKSVLLERAARMERDAAETRAILS